MSLKTKINFLIVITLSLTPVIIVPAFIDYYYFPKIFLIYFFVLCISGLCIINKNNPFSIYDTADKLLYAYYALIVVSTIFSSNLNQSIWGRPLREEGLFALLAYGFLFVITRKYYEFSLKYMKLFLIATFLVTVYGVSQYFGFDPIPKDPMRSGWYNYAFSTLGNPNFFGSFIVLVLPINVFVYISDILSIKLSAIIPYFDNSITPFDMLPK